MARSQHSINKAQYTYNIRAIVDIVSCLNNQGKMIDPVDNEDFFKGFQLYLGLLEEKVYALKDVVATLPYAKEK